MEVPPVLDAVLWYGHSNLVHQSCFALLLDKSLPPPPRHHIIVLEHIFRQSNPGFIACLREVRYGELGEEAQRKVRLP